MGLDPSGLDGSLGSEAHEGVELAFKKVDEDLVADGHGLVAYIRDSDEEDALALLAFSGHLNLSYVFNQKSL